MKSPVTYQGGKSRIAGRIVDAINPPIDKRFYDLCCGSGAISIELVNQGFPAHNIVMVDSGPWGVLWESVSEERFDVDYFRGLCDRIPKDTEMIQGYIKKLSEQPAHIDTEYVFLLLQASSFGGKAIWFSEKNGVPDKWQNTSFRRYWKPTERSKRRSPVNPMMPMPNTIVSRMKEVCKKMKGVSVFVGDVVGFIPKHVDGVVYIDPPYKNTTGYGFDFSVMDVVCKLGNPTFVSEGKSLSEESVCLSAGRSKGGISGYRSEKNQEWLSAFNTRIHCGIDQR